MSLRIVFGSSSREDGSRYKVYYYDIESDYTHLRFFFLNQVYTLESSDLVQGIETVIPEEQQFIPISTMDNMVGNREKRTLEFTVGGNRVKWEVNLCQIWYVKRFKEGLSQFTIPEHQRKEIVTCLGGAIRSDVDCEEFCRDFHLRMMYY